MKANKSFDYIKLEDENQLNADQKDLLVHAKKHLKNSYSPYSAFKVSASVLTEDGEMLNGTNQENMAYPSGLCAERVAFFHAKSKSPEKKILKVAITASSDSYEVNHPITPCGACRQVMLEYEMEQSEDIELILHGKSGKVFVIHKVRDLMPLHFFEDHLRK